LSCQVQSSSRTHRSLDLEIVRRENVLNTIVLEKFYTDYIRNDLCFNYPNLFCSIPYSVPKGDGGVRQFHFLETHLWILYYALGFYFLDLTQAMRTELNAIQTRASIQTYYGANIRLDNPQKSQIHYQEDYQEFTRNIRRTVRRQIHNHKVAVLHLDIQDFFRSIDHARLMQVLADQALPASRLRLRYDEHTRLTIREILFLIIQRPEGLPISPQNIVSNLLSHLFLYPLDCCVREIQMDIATSLTFHRYVDDMFLTVQFPIEEANENIGTTMLDISTRIGEHLSSNLGLSLNPLKTRLDILSSEDEVDDLIERSRLVSFYTPLPEEGGETPQETLNRAVLVLSKLREQFRDRGYVDRIATNDDLALKQCFQNAVVHYTRSQQAQQQLEDVFQDWHPALMPKSIKVLVFLISRAPTVLNTLLAYVREALKSPFPSLTTLHLAEHLMLIDEYKGEFNNEVIHLLQVSSSTYTHLLSRLITPYSPLEKRYINIENDCLHANGSLMRQVRRMIIAEKRGVHSLAYNHLLNTLQEWCFCHQQPTVSRNHYDRNRVVEWLESIASHSEIVFVITMFDRRNRNTISHPGDESIEVTPVDKAEYEEHLARLNLFLPNFLKRLP
jgi:Reverse transcriptase (RNA-dependent DNA polymerase)